MEGVVAELEQVPINIRAPRYCVLEGRARCRKCRRLTRAYAVGLPECEAMVTDEQTLEMEWKRISAPAVLECVRYLSGSVIGQVERLTRGFGPGVGLERRLYFMNHCEWCRAPTEDSSLRGSSGVFSTERRTAPKVERHWVAEEFAGHAQSLVFDGGGWFGLRDAEREQVRS